MMTPPRLELALAPTPILKLERLSRRLGVKIYLERDDLTGLLESGNKVRKLFSVFPLRERLSRLLDVQGQPAA
jgi:1-aminocyclopropane-1-carboxylate deaminase/D-cysteine desulfhydrase-like pyridoxal-dependent ACC family enzyme